VTIAELTGVLGGAEDASAELGFTRSGMTRDADALRAGRSRSGTGRSNGSTTPTVR